VATVGETGVGKKIVGKGGGGTEGPPERRGPIRLADVQKKVKLFSVITGPVVWGKGNVVGGWCGGMCKGGALQGEMLGVQKKMNLSAPITVAATGGKWGGGRTDWRG